MEKKRIIHMVPSTHWDREWYLPFRRFQVRLVRLMDKVIHLLESEKEPYFILDGQTIMLEDYLEVKPWMKDSVHALIRDGKLIVGPWYVVPDTFIPCGESLWKNLEIGTGIRDSYGGGGTVGYTPDSFGIAGQIPQIMSHFGLRNVLYTRGLRYEENEIHSKKHSQVMYASPDGTALLSEYGSYNLGAGFIVPTFWKEFSKIRVTPETAVDYFNMILGSYQGNPYQNKLLVCGVDHMEPREDFPDVVRMLNEAFPDMDFVMSNMDLYFDALAQEIEERGMEQPCTLIGEQRGEYKKHYELGNTLSSRMDIKMLNRQAENKLFYYLSGLNLQEKPCPAFEYLDRDALLHTAEKELIKVHPHDSICTCSVDETNADVKNRLQGVHQLADELIKDDMLKIGASLDADGHRGVILVYNCLPFERTMMVEGKLTIPYRVEGNCVCTEGRVVENSEVEVLFYKRIDIETGKYVYFDETAKDTTRDKIIEADSGDGDIMTGIRYRFLAEKIPGMGFKCFYLDTCEATEGAVDTNCSQYARENEIENEAIRLTVSPDGTVSVYDKQKKVTIENVHRIECCEDKGDEYTYSNPENKVTYAQKAKILSREIGKNFVSVDVEYDVVKPDGQTGEIKLVTTFRLEKNDPIIRMRTVIQNATEDFRIRAFFPAKGKAAYAASDTPFDVTKRPVYFSDELTQSNIMTMPCRNLIHIPADGYGLNLYSASSQEYETVNTEDGSLTALTLLRSVSKVYCTECVTKNESYLGSGTRWWTEDGKMHGETVFDYAMELVASEQDQIASCNAALSYQLPLLCYGVAPQGVKPVTELPGFVLKGAVLSHIDRKDGKLFARIYNPSEEETEAVFQFSAGIEKTVVLGKKKICNICIDEI